MNKTEMQGCREGADVEEMAPYQHCCGLLRNKFFKVTQTKIKNKNPKTEAGSGNPSDRTHWCDTVA
jgi:hypothetical protein